MHETPNKELEPSFRVQVVEKIHIENNTMDRRSGSGRPRTITTEENADLVEDLICSQEDNPGSHLSPRNIEKHTGISRTSVRRMVKRRGLKQFKRLKTPMISLGAKNKEQKELEA